MTPKLEAEFSPDENGLWRGDSKNLLLVLESETGKKVAQIEILPRPTAVIFTFSPNGKCLLTAGFDDNTAGLWETGTGIRLGELAGHDGEIPDVAFQRRRKTGRRRQRAGPGMDLCDRHLRFGEILLALARSRVSRQLTSEELEKYLGTP